MKRGCHGETCQIVSMVNITNKSNSLFLLAIKRPDILYSRLNFTGLSSLIKTSTAALLSTFNSTIHLEETSLCSEISHYNCLHLIQDLESYRIHLCIHYSSFDVFIVYLHTPCHKFITICELTLKIYLLICKWQQKWGYYKSSKILQGELASMV